MVTIRRYKPDDEAAVVAIWMASFGYTAPHNDPHLSIARKVAFQSELFFVAVIDEMVVGTVMGGYDGHRGWIYSLAVADGMRGEGIGTSLVKHVENELRELGCVKVNLQALEENEVVVAFYERLGFGIERRINLGKTLL